MTARHILAAGLHDRQSGEETHGRNHEVAGATDLPHRLWRWRRRQIRQQHCSHICGVEIIVTIDCSDVCMTFWK